MLKYNKDLHNVLTAETECFTQFGDNTDTAHGHMIFQDNGADTLAVAHLDWVSFNPHPKFKKNSITKTPQLDDRLGAYVILYLLPALGVKSDILLCDSEEIGQSTAQYFDKRKQYNWIYEFDRAGTDVVTYGYTDETWDSAIENLGPKVNYGAFSDISSLEHLKCKAANWGVGYHGQHTSSCYANLTETAHMVGKFMEFYNLYKDTLFEHEERPSWYGGNSLWDNKRIDDYPDYNERYGERIYGLEDDDDYDYTCLSCGSEAVMSAQGQICLQCDRDTLYYMLSNYEYKKV